MIKNNDTGFGSYPYGLFIKFNPEESGTGYGPHSRYCPGFLNDHIPASGDGHGLLSFDDTILVFMDDDCD